MSDQWYYGTNGQQMGPVPKATLGQLLAGGQINRQTMVIREGMPDWEEIGNVPELRDILPTPMPPLHDGENMLPPRPSGGPSVDLIGTAWREQFDSVNTYKFKKSGVLTYSYFEAGYDFNQTKKGTWSQNGSSVTIDIDGKHFDLQFTDSDHMEGTYCYPKSTIGDPNEGYEISFYRKKGLFG